MARLILKAANGCISIVLSVVLLVSGAYAVYCLWDNEQIYSAAENVQAELMSFKPKPSPVEEEQQDSGPSFAELMAINPDVCAWVALDNTRIDHPVLQGEDNLDYINTDVYGNFALAGSIFLDSRNDAAFADAYSVLYGHHMQNGGMFGDLDLYEDEAFFRENSSGMLLLPDRAYSLESFACLLVKASDNMIFEPAMWQDGVGGLLDYAEREALHADAAAIAALRTRLEAGEDVRVLAFTTCSSEFTDARTILLTTMEEYSLTGEEATTV